MPDWKLFGKGFVLCVLVLGIVVLVAGHIAAKNEAQYVAATTPEQRATHAALAARISEVVHVGDFVELDDDFGLVVFAEQGGVSEIHLRRYPSQTEPVRYTAAGFARKFKAAYRPGTINWMAAAERYLGIAEINRRAKALTSVP